MFAKRMRPLAAVVAGCIALIGTSQVFAQSTALSQKNTKFSEVPGLDEVPGARAGFEGDPLSNGPATAQQQAGAQAAFSALGTARTALNWKELGPTTPNVAGPATYTGRPTLTSGRITGLAISPKCSSRSCPLFVAAAGGGIWRALDGLSTHPTWTSASTGLPTLSIGSITFDPTDSSGKTLYVGTGEINGSSDSEAGMGLFKSTDLGATWSVVPGSVAAAADRAIGAVAVDPADSQHILIGTGVARHGMSGTYGGRFTPPGAPQIGLYESKDGGATFALAFFAPSDVVVPNTSNGTDFFRGGVTRIEAYRHGRGATQFYFSMMDYGLFRSTAGGYEQVFAAQGGGSALASSVARTEFDLVPMEEGRLRIYLGDADGSGLGLLYRVDNANVAAASLTDGVNNPGWNLLSDPTSGAPGFGSYSFCAGQCSYDMFVASPPGRPDTVWIGGQMQYDDIFRFPTFSNGRAVMRSTDAGVTFTDMTNDVSAPVPNGMHPDQHAIVFQPGNPNVAFTGSDGGLVRNDGRFVDTSAYCGPTPDPANPDPNYRNLTGATLANCQVWLSAVPRTLYTLNDGLATLQFQGIAFDPNNPRGSLIGGTQDNGSWVYDGSTWTQTIGGDGGQAGINSLGTKVHTYTGALGDILFPGGDPALGWNIWGVPSFQNPSAEAASFYSPIIPDPRNPGTWFVGLQHIWRTTDDLGGQAYMQLHCNEFFGDIAQPCGDWQSMGGPDGAGNVGALPGPAYGSDKRGGWIARVEVSPTAGSGLNALWASTRRGRLFISLNPNAANAGDVLYTRIDSAAQPARFISGIAVDPRNSLHAIVTFVGYDAYTPATPGHVFDVRYNPLTGTARWRDITGALGDQPILSVAYDTAGGNIYVGTDYGVAVRGTDDEDEWRRVGSGFPAVPAYDLAFDAKTRTLFAATHGRGIFELDL